MPRKSNYEKYPVSVINGFEGSAVSGYEAVINRLKNDIKSKNQNKSVLVFECYPGVDKKEILRELEKFSPVLVLDSDACAIDSEQMDEMLKPDLTDDRVFGVITTKTLDFYFNKDKLTSAQKKLEETSSGVCIVIGTGATYITKGDILIYCDIARWEIQLRYRKGMSNWNTSNADAPILTKYKRGFFVEWRLADRLKKRLFDEISYLLDTNEHGKPNMVEGGAFLEGLKQVCSMPFRVQPYFDPGVWGGQWMKEVCGLDREQPNFAWSFDGVPEENALAMRFGDVTVTVPAIDAVFYCPVKLLGDRVHARFGTEFPIRFDFLDTMGGQNLSLQVHPLTEYIQENFNMRYTQDESYYMLDAAESDTFVYLGLKKGIDKNEMLSDLRRAEKGEISFPDDKYVNKIPVKKHDHVLIPAGTVHCSGKNTMVLEISATPYIFTFKLWDWDRVGLDGLPRPIHLDHGEKNIMWDRDTDWVMSNLIGQVELLSEENGLKAERTGLHNREFIETIRYTFSTPQHFSQSESVRMLNLVEGEEITITSPTGQFSPYVIHYAETFIIPAGVTEYVMTPSGGSLDKPVMVIEATVRG